MKAFHLLAVMKHWSVDPRVEGSSRREKKPALLKKIKQKMQIKHNPSK